MILSWDSYCTSRKRNYRVQLYVDLKATFDWVPKKILFKSLRLRIDKELNPGIWKCIDVIEAIYADTRSYMVSDFKQSFAGSRLFCLYFNLLLRIFQYMCEQINLGVKIKISISHTGTTRSMRANNPSHLLTWIHRRSGDRMHLG